MSALGLLASYSSESEDTGNDSDSYSKPAKLVRLQSEVLPENVKTRLPLPSLFSKGNEKSEEHTDDPRNHDGRVRRYPHERGNWSTYIYIPYQSNEDFLNLVAALQEECNSVESFNVSEDFHISLSKTLILRFHWINTFISSLRENIERLNEFIIVFDNIKIYTNDDDSRTFIALKINVGKKQLAEVVGKVDKTLIDFSLPLFYDKPSFHISVLWCLGNKKKELNKILPKLQVILQTALDVNDDVQLNQVNVESLVCKTGNKIFNIQLKEI